MHRVTCLEISLAFFNYLESNNFELNASKVVVAGPREVIF
jgi:hypothetical protein